MERTIAQRAPAPLAALSRRARGLGCGLWDALLPALCPACRAVPCPPGEDLCHGCGTEMASLPTPRCPACGGVLDGVLEVCGECLRAGTRPWIRAVSAYRFGGLVRRLVHRFKYQDDTILARPLGRAMAASWEAHGAGEPTVVVPVPLHWTKALLRGYNQAGLLAEVVARVLGLPCSAALRRCQRTSQQAMLDFERRRANVRGAFAPRRVGSVRGRHVLLVDDVFTTGATLAEAAWALLGAGASEVSVLTTARG
ncbi:MAG: ComF family protein [Lentisphaeria bacterium]|nr:ComF family protein [Lentisphaeria bacterium]